MIPKPPDVVRAYIAGYVDGEGCLRWARSTPSLILESCNPYPMRFVASYYGKEVRQLARRTSSTDRPVYRLVYFGADAVTLIEHLQEFLIEKRDQSENLLCMWEANRALQKQRHKKY
jgi:hypothetical protein